MEPGHHNSLKLVHTHPRKISLEVPFQHVSPLFGPFKHLKVSKLVSPHYPIPAARVNFLLPRSHLKKEKKAVFTRSTSQVTAPSEILRDELSFWAFAKGRRGKWLLEQH